MDRFCSNCGQPLIAEARFCPACGSRAPGLDPAATIGSARHPPPAGPAAQPASAAPAEAPPAPRPSVPPVLRQAWARAGSLELRLAALFAIAAVLFAIIGLILSAAVDPGSSGQARGQVWQSVAIVAAAGAAAWAIAARGPGTREILVGGRDLWVLWGLAVATAIFLLVGFIRTAGYEVASDLESGADSYLELVFPSLDEAAWFPFAGTIALLTLGWAALTRQLAPQQGRRLAVALTGVAVFFSIGALIIGHFGDDDNDVYDALIRAAAWHGLALVLVVLAAAALLARRPEQPGE